MIREVRFSHCKGLRDAALRPGRLSVLVGRNGIGKSTALEAIKSLSDIDFGRRWARSAPSPEGLHTYIDASREIAASLASKPEADRFGLRLEDEQGATLEWNWTSGPAPFESRLRVGLAHHGRTYEHDDETGFTDPSSQAFFEDPYEFPSTKLLGLSAKAIASPHALEEEVPGLETDGGGVASVLQYLQGLRDGTLEAIEQQLGQIVHGVRRLRALPTRIHRREHVRITINDKDASTEQWREVTGARFEVEMRDVGWITADQLSEGTLLALGLLTALHWRPPSVLLLDDIDKALHPVAQRSLIRLLRQLLDSKSGLQIIATSHSPFVLDALDAEEVFVVGPSGPGASAIRRLTGHPSWTKRSAYMAPGEFWSLVGEGWVSESEP